MADSFARRGESEARADWRPMVETQIERTTKLLRKKTQPARPIQLNRSGSTPLEHLPDDVLNGNLFDGKILHRQSVEQHLASGDD